MQGNANWFTGFLFSISCFQGWSIWTELLCSTSLRSVECQCSRIPSRHRKSTASIEPNVGLLSTRPPATPSMDSDRWNPPFYVCSEVRALHVCQLPIPYTATPVNSLHLSATSPAPLRAAAFSLGRLSFCPAMQSLGSTTPVLAAMPMALPFPWNFSWTQAPCVILACLTLPSQPPPTRSSCLGQKPGFWLRKINLNGCSSEFNDPC